MYSTCTFCHRSLGSNAAIPVFPVGQRLTFDASNGRLWVVCKSCAQWNLSPLDERWEAIDSAEELFRSARMRHSTDNIGMARLGDGTELVRIGAPLKPEFAAWRYGATFANRRRSIIASLVTGTAVLGAGALLLPTASVLAGMVAGAVTVGSVALQIKQNGGDKIAFKHRVIRGAGDRYFRVARDDVPHIRLVSDASGWALKLPHEFEGRTNGGWWGPELGHTKSELLTGDDAIVAARQILPLVNGFGARASVVNEAVTAASEWSDASAGFRDSVRHVHDWAIKQAFGDTGSLSFLPAPVRLALEMSLHQDEERLALEGELTALKQSWIDAEQIASIADNLLIPGSVDLALRKLRDRSSRK